MHTYACMYMHMYTCVCIWQNFAHSRKESSQKTYLVCTCIYVRVHLCMYMTETLKNIYMLKSEYILGTRFVCICICVYVYGWHHSKLNDSTHMVVVHVCELRMWARVCMHPYIYTYVYQICQVFTACTAKESLFRRSKKLLDRLASRFWGCGREGEFYVRVNACISVSVCTNYHMHTLFRWCCREILILWSWRSVMCTMNVCMYVPICTYIHS